MKKEILCPCKSGKKYAECCEKYHQGGLPETALALMRSRYSGYALGLADYIVRTTHPVNPLYNKDPKERFDEIMKFSNDVDFDYLEIIDFTDGEELAFVTFKAGLIQDGLDVSFTERSRFLKVKGQWLYADGVRI